MRLSTVGLGLIEKEEGLRLRAYWDVAGILTIGFGHTGKDVLPGLTINVDRARELLMSDAQTAVDAVKNVQQPLTQNQFDALVSLVFNIGVGAFQRSTLLKKANVNPNDPTIKKEFSRWVRGGGRVLPVLVGRRKREADLYFRQ